MTADSPELAEVGPWAEEKLDVLERYLDAYTKVFKAQSRYTTIYVDAFAGGGQARIRQRLTPVDTHPRLFDEPITAEQEKFVEGSPSRALRIANPFNSYIFVDADPARIASLNALKAEYGQARRITVREGLAEEQIDWIISKNPTRANHRGIAFLDPFGGHIKWRTVSALAQTGVFEVIVNFPIHMATNRLMTRSAEIPPNWREQLDSHFPEGWYEQAYDTDPGMFDSGPTKRPDAASRLLSFYREHLRRSFGHVSTPRLIRNTRKTPLYYLLWAGPHPKGLEIANHIMKMGERLPS